MSNLTVFGFNNSEVRVVEINGEYWFVGKDIANILEYHDPNKMTNLVEPEDKQNINPKRYAQLAESLSDNVFRISVINESGLYSCIFNSTKPEAKVFKKWITNEVLPTLRKTGQYTLNGFKIPQTKSEALFLAAELAKKNEELESRNQKLLVENKQLDTKIQLDAPKVEFAETISTSEDVLSWNDFAKVIGIGRNTMLDKLRKKRILNSNNVPYQTYLDREYFEVTESKTPVGIRLTTRVTGKGQLYLTRILTNK